MSVVGSPADGFHTVARLGEIAVGAARSVVVEGKLVAVFNLGGTYRAMSDLCPHQGAPLSDGHLEGDAVMCPWHAWRFRVTDGCWIDNPRSPIRVPCYSVRIVGDEIQVSLSPPVDPAAPAPAPAPAPGR